MHDIIIAWHSCANYMENVCTLEFHTLMTTLYHSLSENNHEPH